MKILKKAKDALIQKWMKRNALIQNQGKCSADTPWQTPTTVGYQDPHRHVNEEIVIVVNLHSGQSTSTI